MQNVVQTFRLPRLAGLKACTRHDPKPTADRMTSIRTLIVAAMLVATLPAWRPQPGTAPASATQAAAGRFGRAARALLRHLPQRRDA